MNTNTDTDTTETVTQAGEVKFQGPVEVQCKVRISYPGYAQRREKSVIYVSSPSPDEVFGLAQPAPSCKGDDPENDRLWRKYNKAELAIQRGLLQLKRAELLKAFGFEGENPDVVFKWSRTAGCSCGCSPGWLAYLGTERIHRNRTNWNVKVWITAKTESMKAAEVARREAVARAEAEKFIGAGI